jgi:hypothetical protein
MASSRLKSLPTLSDKALGGQTGLIVKKQEKLPKVNPGKVKMSTNMVQKIR